MALCAPLDPKAEPRSSSPAASFLSPQLPVQGAAGPSARGLRIWRVQGVKVAMRQAAASSPTLASLPPPHKSASSSIRCPRLWLWGAGAWQPSGECPRRAPKPAPPSAKTHSPSFYGEGKARALDPYSGKRPERRAGAKPTLMPFLAQQLWALPFTAAGAGERGERETAVLLQRPPPLPARCRRIAAGTEGWASSREGRSGSPGACGLRAAGAELGWI